MDKNCYNCKYQREYYSKHHGCGSDLIAANFDDYRKIMEVI